MKFLFSAFLMFFFDIALGQENVTISGLVTNVAGEPLEGVTIKTENFNIQTNQYGKFLLREKKGNISVSFSFTGFITQTQVIQVSGGKKYQMKIILLDDVKSLEEVIINKESNLSGNLIRIRKELFESFPSASGNFEAILKTLPGVSSNNELSAQYSVRGGNFDENLLYINDIEIYRPISIRSGQQEGLSLINPELISRVIFSAGGFGAKYGDKMSSVLDVRYRKPDSADVTVSASFLGLSTSAKLPYKKGFLLLGVRNKTNKGLLSKQRLTGSFEPRFYDFQLMFNTDLSSKLNCTFFGDYNLTGFTLVPKSDETVFGTLNSLKKLSVNFAGKEVDRNISSVAGLSTLFKPSNNLNLKLITSISNNLEKENIDINSAYLLKDEPAINKSSNDTLIRGIGTFYSFAENTLRYSIASVELKAYQQINKQYLEWGIGYRSFRISDKINELNLTDSSGFTSPGLPAVSIISDSVNLKNSINPASFSAYVQNTLSLTSGITATIGIRTNYSSFTKETLISPRLNVAYKASPLLSYRFSAGWYAQPPFYRELRDFNGELNFKSKAQKSLHLLVGTDYVLKASGKELRLTSEVYFKRLFHLIPYKLENLRLRYFAREESSGYASGADFNLSGEFVEGLVSNFRLSLMKTGEDIRGDYKLEKQASGYSKKEVGYLKRPTDQRVNFSINFQDRLLQNPTYKVHLSLLYGSKLPIGPPHSQRYQDIFKIPAYRRVDIGFSKDFVNPENASSATFKYFNSFTIYAEVFNLLNINNTVSYLWVRDVSNNQYAVPAYLTSRQLNLKIIAKIK